jgi:hypothetical protein
MSIEDIKQISIMDYLRQRGFTFNNKGNKSFCKSPFSRDTNWSFCYYHATNSFYDWSQGFGGTIIDLVMAMENCDVKQACEHLQLDNYPRYQPNYKASKNVINTAPFEYTRYLTQDEKEIAAIQEYANARRVYNGYESGVFFTRDAGNWVRHPSIMLLHRDEHHQICGAKFRKIQTDTPTDKNNGPRFSSRGRMAFYILEHVDTENFGDPVLYVVEGEINANSLWQYCQLTGRNCIVISFGGVSNLPNGLPHKYKDIKDKKLIIDFDGDEELYSKRLLLYEPYGLEPVKLQLPKGEDINSLFCKNQLRIINHLL